MKIGVYSAKRYERIAFDDINRSFNHDLHYFETHLNSRTAALARGLDGVCAFVNDCLDREVIEALSNEGVKILALRSAGFNHVDLTAAAEKKLPVVRVPAYSPHAIAEHTLALILSLNRKIHKAYNRVREGNFSLEGLTGFDVASRKAGVVGTGNIGSIVARILIGFGCEVVAFDPQPNRQLESIGVKFVSFDELISDCGIITLHCPLNAKTQHLIDAPRLASMRRGVMLINTGRGGLIDTKAVIGALKTGQVGYLGLDVYEEEEGIFFEDLSNQVIGDDVFSRLLTFPNVLITGHQAFLTNEALGAIARITLENLTAFENGEPLVNEVRRSV